MTDIIAAQFEAIYDEIDRVDGEITALDDRTTANEDEIENINYILEQFGAVYQQVVQSENNRITVPTKVNKVAHINSFGGMTYRKLLGFPKYTTDFYNLLPYPYFSITSGATEVNGYVYNLPWEYGTVWFCQSGTNSITITETGTYRFEANVVGSLTNPLFVLAYTKVDGTANSEYINGNKFERNFEAGDVITSLSFGADWGSDATETFSIHPVFYKVVYYYEEDGTQYQASPDVPFEPVVYELENTKITELSTWSDTDSKVATIPIPEDIQALPNYGVGVTGYTNPVDVVEDVAISNTKTINLSAMADELDISEYNTNRFGMLIRDIFEEDYNEMNGICTHAEIDSSYAGIRIGNSTYPRSLIWLGIANVLGIETLTANEKRAAFREWLKRQADEGNPVILTYGSDNPTSTPLSEPFDGLIDVVPRGQVKCTTDTGAAAPFEVEFQKIGDN